ncbi:hypothetical protein [Nonomuraea helvata]|uniref:Uncharacterized protein n=1 Tax=Nonomuraea helvata TaxID=37484 RepID=A0ABV5S6S3_9ACTN
MAEAPSLARPVAPSPGPEKKEPPADGSLRRAAAWLPATAVVLSAGGTAVVYGVSVADLALFSVYVLFGIVLPGLLLVRAFSRRAHPLPEELALGLTLGYALEVLTYVPARALGLPLLFLAWPISTYAVFLAVPRLRRYWKRDARAGRTPLWWSWCLALIMICLVVWTAVSLYSTNSLTWPVLGVSSVDMPFHLSLVGELKHHMPPMVPTVAGEPLVYHWFVYAHLAATSWVTGIEPLVLLFRLAMLPMYAALVITLAALGRRVTGSRGGALCAVAGTVFLLAPDLYLHTISGLFTWNPVQSWSSPTQVFGAVLFTPVVLLLIDVLELRRPTWGRWVLLGVMLVAVTGAKATYLPLLAAGLVAVAAVETLRRRRAPWRVLGALGLSAVCLIFAQFVLFGGARQGMVFDPLSLVRVTWRNLTGLGRVAEVPSATMAGVTLLCLLCGAIAWCGVLGLLRRPLLLLRPVVVLALAMSVSGCAVALLFAHPHLSQAYFLQGPYPYLAMVAAHGLTLVVRSARAPLAAVVLVAGLAMAAVYIIKIAFNVQIPLGSGDDIILYLPYLALLGVVLLTALVLRVLRQDKRRVCALILCMVTAAGSPAAWFVRALPGTRVPPSKIPSAWAVPVGLFAAGRWLRAHSRPGDLVATNVHCRIAIVSKCETREFWVAALSERRVLVEGWTYTATNMDRWRPGQVAEDLPFWDLDRIRANDSAFQQPSAETIGRLRNDFGVRWLLADERRLPAGVSLDGFAECRYRAGDYAVYRLPSRQR